MQLFTSTVEWLNGCNLAYLHLVEGRGSEVGLGDALTDGALNNARVFRRYFGGRLISAGAYTPASASQVVESGYVDAIAFGRNFISNPDLPLRVAEGSALAPYNRGTFYGGGECGYTDYPTGGEARA